MRKLWLVAAVLMLSTSTLVAGSGVSQAAIDQTWLNNHCRLDMFGYKSTAADLDKDTGVHAINIVVIKEAGSSWTTNIADLFEPKLELADSWLAKSHSTVKQHWKMACRGSSSGSWLGLHYSYVDAPLTSSDGSDADTNNNGNVGCGEAEAYATNQAGWNGKHRHYFLLLDNGIDLETYSNGDQESCTYAWNGVGFTSLDARVPGTSNAMNESSGYAVLYRGVWQSSNHHQYAQTVAHELYHSLGAVHRDAPGSCYAEGCGAHTDDNPDVMRYGGYGITTDCTTAANNAIPEAPGAYMDCGRNSYWAPNPGLSNYLCTNYNIATDSFYLFNRQSRTSGCAA